MAHDEIDPEVVAKRRERFEAELRDEYVLVGDYDGDEDPPYDVVIDELMHARFAPAHEQRLAPYGAMVLPGPPGAIDHDELLERLEEGFDCEIRWLDEAHTPHDLDPASLERMRMLSDGASSFVLTSCEGVYGLALLADASDATMAYLAQQDLPIVTVRRASSGDLALFERDALHVSDQSTWRTTGYLSPEAGVVVGMAFGAGSWAVFSELLHFCQFELAPAHIGATFVLYLTDDGTPDAAFFASPGRNPPISLSIRERELWKPLARLLDQVDGAVILSEKGDVIALEAHLATTEAAIDAIPATPGKGTRHLSGRRFSFDETRCVVVVVSQDGPISIFSDGADPFRFSPVGPSWVIWLRGWGHLGAATFEREMTDCPHCGKRLAIGVVSTGEDDPPQDLVCPVCASVVEAGRTAYLASVTPLKPWHDEKILDNWELLASRPPGRMATMSTTTTDASRLGWRFPHQSPQPRRIESLGQHPSAAVGT